MEFCLTSVACAVSDTIFSFATFLFVSAYSLTQNSLECNRSQRVRIGSPEDSAIKPVCDGIHSLWGFLFPCVAAWTVRPGSLTLGIELRTMSHGVSQAFATLRNSGRHRGCGAGCYPHLSLCPLACPPCEGSAEHADHLKERRGRLPVAAELRLGLGAGNIEPG